MAISDPEVRGDGSMLTASRLSSLARRYPLAVDLLLAAAVLLISLPVISDSRHRVAGIVLAVALALPLVWRRHHPFGVFLLLSGVALVQWFADIKLGADVALLVALYTVAANESRRRALIAAGLLELGGIIAALRWAPDGGFRQFIALSALTVAAALLGTSVRHRRTLLGSLEDRAARLELERDQQGQISAAAERARIAREMHDIVAHNLTVMIALADGAAFSAERSPEQATLAMQTVSSTGRQALSEMRRLLGVLREDDGGVALLPQPGVNQIDQLLEQVRAAGLPVTLEVTGDGRNLPAGAQLTVFRLVQEALTNTLKHAGTTAAARVRLRYDGGDAIDVEVTDSGTATTPLGVGGRGLEGMRERASAYAGTVEAGPRSDGGWRVHTRLLLAPGSARA